MPDVELSESIVTKVGHVPAVFVIGKSRNSELALEHLSISRQHALVLFMADGSTMLMDLESTCGTKVKGKGGMVKLKPHVPLQLTMGMTVRFGASSRLYTVARPRHRPPQRARS